MKTIHSVEQMQRLGVGFKKRDSSVGFVPTMGALHAGHARLIEEARRNNQIVVVSIFVNPTQFAPKEDLAKYPRMFNKDALLCRKLGVDYLFYPTVEEMYPAGYKTFVEVTKLGERLCGKTRPIHFRGVTTVVLKLFNIIQPTAAYFGQKDAQQVIIVGRMAKDLNIQTKIKVVPTVRQSDGLALSSRNAYLSSQERFDALVLNNSLIKASQLVLEGENKASVIRAAIKQMISQTPSARIEYIEAVDLEELKPVTFINQPCLIALAVWIGKTRLIDNLIISPSDCKGRCA